MPIPVALAVAGGTVVGGALFGLAYGSSVRYGYQNLYPDLMANSSLPSMPNYAGGTISGMGTVNIQVSPYSPVWTESQLLQGIANEQKARESALENDEQLPPGATVLPDGRISYHGQLYEQKMPSSYSRVTNDSDGQGPYLYRPFNYAGYYNWPSRFYGNRRY